MSIISLIAAIDENNAIGKNGDMLCHLPGDLKHFKAITEGHVVIMGRKTFESLPNGALPNRRNIVISRNTSLKLKDCEIFDSLESALKETENEKEVFIIGGGEIYSQSMSLADKLYITHIQHSFKEADTYFPVIESTIWKEDSKTANRADEQNKFDYTFSTYVRIS